MAESNVGKKLSAVHVWALGVGIVLVGEFMGWNYAVKLGGSMAPLIGVPLVIIMYYFVVKMTNEMALVIPESGGQYSMSKFLMGPLAAFNVALMMVLEYTMLEAGDVIVVGQILNSINPGIQVLPFMLLSLLALAYINYHGAYASLTLNFVITAIAFGCVIMLLVFNNLGDLSGSIEQLKTITNGIPYGPLGIMASLQFCCWFFLGIEGTAMTANEVGNTKRDVPMGSLLGLLTLFLGGAATWFICSTTIPAGLLSESVYPLFEAAQASGKLFLVIALFVGTVFACLASANGCIMDAARAWSVLSRDGLLPEVFGKLHPKFNSPYRAIIFLIPIAAGVAMTGLLDQAVTLSVFSAMAVYILTAVKFLRFRKVYPLDKVKRVTTVRLHPLPACAVIVICSAVLLGMTINYGTTMIAAAGFYLVSSAWFLLRRQKMMNTRAFYASAIDALGYPVLEKKARGHVGEQPAAQPVLQPAPALATAGAAVASDEKRCPYCGAVIGKHRYCPDCGRQQFPPFQTIERGDIFRFGNYHGNMDWVVLDKADGKLLLMTEECIDCRAFHHEWTDVSWETSDLRKWMNKDFLEKGFNENERSIIVESRVAPGINPSFQSYPGQATMDKVFLLSILEAEKYLDKTDSDCSMQAEATDYAKEWGACISENGKTWWRLRSPGIDQRSTAYVGPGGRIVATGMDVDYAAHGIRPAMWISVE